MTTSFNFFSMQSITIQEFKKLIAPEIPPRVEPAEDDYACPERRFKNLVLMRDGKMSEEARAQLDRDEVRQYPHHYGGTREQLCWACGWTSGDQCYSSYEPRIKIFHTRANIGLWTIGSKWMIRDQPNDHTLGNDYMTNQFLRQHLGSAVPIVEMQRLSQPADKIQYTLMSRAQGDTLWTVWETLTAEEKSSYSKQLAGYIKQWRQFTAPAAMKVDGSQLDDTVVGVCIRRHPPTCKKLGHTKEAWLENIADELRQGLRKHFKIEDEATLEAKLDELKEGFPSGEPFVLTHADLNLSNIIVKDGEITAVIDWEMAGFFPWWAEKRNTDMLGDEWSREFFDAVWAEVYTKEEMDMLAEQLSGVRKVFHAYNWCPKDHPDFSSQWFRPGFCDCKRYGGAFRWVDLGVPIGHEIKKA